MFRHPAGFLGYRSPLHQRTIPSLWHLTAGGQWLSETRATLSLHYVFAVVFCPAEETFQLSIIVRYFFLAQLLLLDCFLVH